MEPLQTLLQDAGIMINMDQLQKFLELLLQWNKRVNLVSRTDETKLIERHVLESLSVLLAVNLQYQAQIIDIGSGGGFPALPVCLVRPDLNFVLVESRRMKALFLRAVVHELKLNQVRVICDRVEKLSSAENWQDRFDFAFCRAVANLEIVYPWSYALLKPNGVFIAWKGGNIQTELNNVVQKYQVTVDVIPMDHRLVARERKKVFVMIQRSVNQGEAASGRKFI